MLSNQPSRLASLALIITSAGCMVFMVLLVVIAGALTPGYSHVSQFISELGATGAAFEWWVRFAGFLPAGILLLSFCAVALGMLPRSLPVSLSLLGLAIYAAGYLVAAAFPCDPGCRPPEPSSAQIIHNVGGLMGYLLAPVFLITLAGSARTWPNASRLSVAGYAASAVALVSLVTLSPSSEHVGLSQRALELAVLGWVVMLGIYLARQDARAIG